MKALKSWRKQHYLFCDMISLTTAVIIALTIVANTARTSDIVRLLLGARTTLYGTASAGCVALLGFVITTTTITDAVMQNPQWEKFRKSFAYSQVQDTYFSTIRWLGVSTLIFLIFLITDTDAHPYLLCEATSVWLVGVVTIRMWRSIGALELLLRMNSFKMTSKAK